MDPSRDGFYGVSLVIQDAYAGFPGRAGADRQAMLHAAMGGGALPFTVAFLGGAILTPVGEEFLFRGVVANALNRYGAWAGVGLSALIFGIVHGLGVILPLAIMVGLLFRMTGSVWPGAVLHAVYDGLHSVGSALS